MNVVYMIHDVDFAHYYIGSSDDAKRRCKHHFSALRGGKHHCEALQRAFNKYGEEAFIFEVARDFAAIEAAREYEHQLLQDNHGKIGCLNSSSSGLVAHQCPVVVAKRNMTLKSAEHRARASEKAKAWRVANPDKAREADRKSAITRSTSEEWRRANAARVAARSSTAEAKAAFAERIAKFYANGGVNGFAKPVVRIADDGTETVFASGAAAALAVGAHINGISRCCLGKGRTAAGFQWRFA